MTKQLRIAGVLVAAGVMAATLVAGVSPAVANPADAADSQDVTADLEVLAASLEISEDEAARRFGGQEAFYGQLEEVRAIAVDAVVFAEWKEGFGVIHVRPEIADHARALIGDSATELRVLDGIGERSQSSAVEHVSAALADAGQESFVASFDLDSTSVVVETFGPAVTDAETLSARAGLRNENAVNVRVTEVPKELAPEPAARGGMAYSSCTGGFIVKSGITRYIATAHHCTTKPATYDGAATGPSVIASSYDVRRTYLSGSHGATFRRDVGVYSTATSYGNPAFGGYVCKFGTTTHLTCSVVDGTGQCVKYPDWPQFCGMFRTMSDIVDPGDSGGPAFNGGRALGLVSGHSPGATSWFSQISTLSGLGVTVVTG